ncbi:MAG TPA: BatD family protein [Smithella sp.]|nr:BatD family protein [Smithella sp.]
MSKIGKILFIIGFVLCFFGRAIAADLTFSASVDKNSVALDDTVQYTLTVSGNNAGNVPGPELPKFSNLNVVSQSQSSNFSIINGQMSSSKSFIYALQPEKMGKAHIGQASINIGGKTYTTEPVEITVTKAEGKKTQPQTQGGIQSRFPGFFGNPDEFFNSHLQLKQPQMIKDPFKVELKASQTTVYVNQQIMLTFTIYRRVNSYQSYIKPPDTKGFLAISLPEDKKLREVTLNGVKYIAQDFRTIIFPTTAGNFSIGPATFVAKADPFSAGETLQTESLKIKVLPLPKEGKPDNFSGAVGDFQMDVSLKQNKIERGQPIQLTAVIQGKGNIQSISEPLSALPKEFKKLSASGKENVTKDTSGLAGSKSFDIVLIPLKEGAFTLPPFEFSYFDPLKKEYRTLKSRELNVNILPSSAPIPQEYEKSLTGETAKKQVGISIPWDKIGAATLKTLTSVFFWLPAAVIIILIIIFALYRKYQKRLMADPSRMRQRQALKVAKTRLKKAHRLLKKNELKEFLSEIFNATAKYLGDKYGFAAAGITTDGLRDILNNKGLSPEAQKQLEDFITECDLLRFTPSSLSGEKAFELSRVAENLIITIEKLT